MEARHVYKGILCITGQAKESNIYVIDKEILVDTGTGLYFPSVKRLLEPLDLSIKAIINTHFHFDHTGGNKKFRDWLKIDIAIHHDDKHFLESGTTLSELFNETGRSTTADIAVDAHDFVRTPHFTFSVLHTPGHSPGSICLYEPRKRILFSGDTILPDGIGKSMLPHGNEAELSVSAEKLSALNISHLFPGHGNTVSGKIDFLIRQMIIQNKESDYM